MPTPGVPCHPQGHIPCLSEATRSHRTLLLLSSGLPQSCHTDCHCPELPQVLAVSSPRVFGQDGNAAPHTQPVLQIRNSGLAPLSPVLKELQRNEGGWHTQVCALGMDSSIFTPVKNVPELKRAGCVNLELSLKPRSRPGTACSSTPTSGMEMRRVCCNQNRSLKSLAISVGHSGACF